jgi:hypothetical protein
MRKNVPAGGLAGLIGALALGLVMQFTPTVVTGGPLPSTVAAARILHLHCGGRGGLRLAHGPQAALGGPRGHRRYFL